MIERILNSIINMSKKIRKLNRNQKSANITASQTDTKLNGIEDNINRLKEVFTEVKDQIQAIGEMVTLFNGKLDESQVKIPQNDDDNSERRIERQDECRRCRDPHHHDPPEEPPPG
jgi:chromosome segregation ATPase